MWHSHTRHGQVYNYAILMHGKRGHATNIGALFLPQRLHGRDQLGILPGKDAAEIEQQAVLLDAADDRGRAGAKGGGEPIDGHPGGRDARCTRWEVAASGIEPPPR